MTDTVLIRIAAAGGVALVLAAYGGWSRGASTPPPVQPVRAVEWTLPIGPPPRTYAALELLRQRDAWGMAGKPAPRPGAAPVTAEQATQRIGAVITRQGAYVALVLPLPGAPADNRLGRLLGPGESLEGGWIIQDLHPTHIVLRREGETRTVQLFNGTGQR